MIPPVPHLPHLPARLRLALAAGVAVLLVTGLALVASHTRTPQPREEPVPAEPSEKVLAPEWPVVPRPAQLHPAPAGQDYRLTAATEIHTAAGATAEAEYLAALLRPTTGYPVPVRESGEPREGISLLLDPGDATGGDTGAEGYRMETSSRGVVLRAATAAGLFHGIQTLRQLLPVAGPDWTVPGGRIVDRPRFGYRGAMLDVARHFFTVEQVRRYIDQLALYKINFLHLHLTDDQGWRIAIESWPRLASWGGGTEVGGGPGGSYTAADYRRIVEYAAARHMTVVPEIDMPGHTNAALASYPELNCNGVAPPRYTGDDVGFSALCVSKEITYRFVEDVVREVAELTPGPYLHIGGDEVETMSTAEYGAFMQRAQQIVARHGKTAVGWHQIVDGPVRPETVAQYWGTKPADAATAAAAGRGTKLIMSPASHAYLDMKYEPYSPLGQRWAGYIEVQQAYGWNPGEYLAGVPESAVLGVEAPLWSETLRSSADLEYLAFPRLAVAAELAWAPAQVHDWTTFVPRLAAQGPRWRALGLNYYRSPQVPWPAGS